MAYSEYLERLRAAEDNGMIKVLTGPRNCGKSTAFRKFIDILGLTEPNAQIRYFDLASMEYDAVRSSGQLHSLAERRIVPDEKNYLFFDEIQQVQGWEEAIDAISRKCDADIYVASSVANPFSPGCRLLLSDRIAEIRMLPFSFGDYCHHYRLSPKSREDLFEEYLKYGGFPQFLDLSLDEETRGIFLGSLYDTLLLNGALARGSIRDTVLLKRVFSALCKSVGEIVSANSLAKAIAREAKLGKPLRPATVAEALAALENSFLVYRADRYDIKAKQVLKSLEKYYIADPGLRNLVCPYSEKSAGSAIENIVYLELLRRGYDVYVGKAGDKQVDFVALSGDEIRYYQVAETVSTKKALEKELSPLASINDHYEKTIISLDKNCATNHNGIKVVNILDFLLF